VTSVILSEVGLATNAAIATSLGLAPLPAAGQALFIELSLIPDPDGCSIKPGPTCAAVSNAALRSGADGAGEGVGEEAGDADGDEATRDADVEADADADADADCDGDWGPGLVTALGEVEEAGDGEVPCAGWAAPGVPDP
jgi:hypothetical protein